MWLSEQSSALRQKAGALTCCTCLLFVHSLQESQPQRALHRPRPRGEGRPLACSSAQCLSADVHAAGLPGWFVVKPTWGRGSSYQEGLPGILKASSKIVLLSFPEARRRVVGNGDSNDRSGKEPTLRPQGLIKPSPPFPRSDPFLGAIAHLEFPFL